MYYLFSFMLAFIFTVQGFAVNAFVELKKFNTADNKPFVELQIMLPGTSLNFVENATGQYQAAVEVLILIKQDEEIAAYDKYILNSDTLGQNEYMNLLDIKRFALEQGNYNLEISFTDINQSEQKKEIQHTFDIDFPPNEISLSDITLAEKIEKQETENIYAKSGYEVIPNTINFFSGNHSELGFYAEIYGTDKIIKDDAYMISYAVMDESLAKVIKGLRKFKKASPSPVEVVMAVFNIEDLPSGNYQFSIEVRNKQNELLTNKTISFQRSKPMDLDAAIETINQDIDISNTFVENYTKVDSLDFYLGSLLPLVHTENYQIINNAIKSRDIDVMQRVLYNYLKMMFPLDTESEFNLFKKVVLTVHDKYQTLTMKGHETDRGRFFIKYGLPDEIIIGKEEGASPYEIWIYNKVEATNQTHVKSIFYNPKVATNTFPLLHSEIRGEIYNEYWELDLYSHDRIGIGKRIDVKDLGDSRGVRAKKIFDEFYVPEKKNE